MLTEIPERDAENRRGRWQRILIDEFEDAPRYGAIIWCPECAKPLAVVDHHIADDGQISPSVGHPDSYPPCGWHTNPRLVGWKTIPPPPPRPTFNCERCGAKGRQLGGWGTWGGGAGVICPSCVAALFPPHSTGGGNG